MSERKTDSARKRMRELMYRGPKSPIPPGIKSSPGDPLWVTEAKFALSIVPLTEANFNGQTVKLPEDWIDYSALALSRLFDHFKLDPDQPLHWRWLVNLFAYSAFWEGPKKKRGRPKEWTEEREAELATALASLPGQSAFKIARRLANDKKSSFVGKSISVSSGRSLRGRIGKIRKKPKTKVGT